MNKKIILIPPNFAYGDCLSVIGMINYLLCYYDIVYFYLNYNNNLINYYTTYFENDNRFNHNIFIINDPEKLINNGSYGEYHICNVLTGGWESASFNFSELSNINKEYYFNDINPLYNKLDISLEHICHPNKHIPSETIELNHLFYYELIGLNNNVRMNYFSYNRNISSEIDNKNMLLMQRGIGSNGKYNIINDPIGAMENVVKHIKNGHPTININYLATCPGQLIKLLEDAEEIHFIEGCNVNFFYHCQYKNIFNYDKPIYFHVWARNRDWLYPNLNMDYAWKMMDTPRLNNWKFIFNENEINIA